MSLFLRTPGQKRPSTRLSRESLERRRVLSTMPSPAEPPESSDAALALVPDAQVTAQAVRSGAWSSPGTWQNSVVPTANANVLIPVGDTVTVDTTTASLHTLR